jgi:hypothetical protein
MSDLTAELIAILKEVGAKVTFDSGRNFNNPCTFCGTKDEPRELVDIGHYFNGDLLTRPVCKTCKPKVPQCQTTTGKTT